MQATLDQITGDAQSITAARRAVRAMVAGYRDDLAAVAELLTDELLTNAVLHGGGQFGLTARVDETRLRVIVSDVLSSERVTVYPPGHELEYGRGMTIVDAMASKWGVERHGSEKSIWFELDLRSSEAAEFPRRPGGS
jgi:anti-sigma regulatory factor (Ser/Thr protein kinase)